MKKAQGFREEPFRVVGVETLARGLQCSGVMARATKTKNRWWLLVVAVLVLGVAATGQGARVVRHSNMTNKELVD